MSLVTIAVLVLLLIGVCYLALVLLSLLISGVSWG